MKSAYNNDGRKILIISIIVILLAIGGVVSYIFYFRDIIANSEGTIKGYSNSKLLKIVSNELHTPMNFVDIAFTNYSAVYGSAASRYDVERLFSSLFVKENSAINEMTHLYEDEYFYGYKVKTSTSSYISEDIQQTENDYLVVKNDMYDVPSKKFLTQDKQVMKKYLDIEYYMSYKHLDSRYIVHSYIKDDGLCYVYTIYYLNVVDNMFDYIKETTKIDKASGIIISEDVQTVIKENIQI